MTMCKNLKKNILAPLLQAMLIISILLVCPLPGYPRPVPHLALPSGISLTPLGIAALAKLLLVKKVVGVGLLGVKKLAAVAAVGGKDATNVNKIKSFLVGLMNAIKNDEHNNLHHTTIISNDNSHFYPPPTIINNNNN